MNDEISAPIIRSKRDVIIHFKAVVTIDILDRIRVNVY